MGQGGVFSVRLPYKFFEAFIIFNGGLSELEEHVFRYLWKSSTPSKAIAFSWKLLLNRIPTRVSLALQNALREDPSTICVFCGGGEETSNHLFLQSSLPSGGSGLVKGVEVA